MGDAFTFNIPNVEIFRAGDYSKGGNGVWSDADVADLAKSYNPALLEGRVTQDHKQEGPKFGVVKTVRAEGGRLFADLAVDPKFGEQIKGGFWADRSVEVYRNMKEADGKPYLRAVTFLGAEAPRVKGMEPIRFSDDHGECQAISMSDAAGEQKPAEPISVIVMSDSAAMVEFAGNVHKHVPLKRARKTEKTEEKKMPDKTEEKAETFADKQAFDALKAQVDKFAESDKAKADKIAALEKRNSELEFASFADGVVKALREQEGGPRITPAIEPKFREALKAASTSGDVLKFSDNASANALVELFKSLPAFASTKEVAEFRDSGADSEVDSFSEADKKADAAARKYMAEHNCGYADALIATSKKN